MEILNPENSASYIRKLDQERIFLSNNQGRIEISDCMDFLDRIESNSIDLVITSPPYADQRKNCYNSTSEKEYPDYLERLGRKVLRVLKNTGSFVLNLKEFVKEGRRSTYVLKTVLRLADIFLWNDTYIWHKPNAFPSSARRRLKDGFEYCFLFTKTKDYKFFADNVKIHSKNKNLVQENKRKGQPLPSDTNGSKMTLMKRYSCDNDFLVYPSNVISICAGVEHTKHPAAFPLELPKFFVKLLTEENDIVLDPFMGSGTSLVASNSLNRRYLGCDIEEKYVKIALDRLEEASATSLQKDNNVLKLRNSEQGILDF